VFIEFFRQSPRRGGGVNRSMKFTGPPGQPPTPRQGGPNKIKKFERGQGGGLVRIWKKVERGLSGNTLCE
jgi:hypothetical protein